MSPTVRFYAELRDLLDDPSGTVVRSFIVPGTVKDLIESCGVPHTEVDLVLVNGEPVDFSHRVDHEDRVSVFPVFETFDVGAVTKVRADPLREIRFVADVHLGRLTRYLRLLGFDTAYQQDRTDRELVTISVDEHRILLTRDVELLEHRSLTHGTFIRTVEPRRQLLEVVARFHLSGRMAPFTRCMSCNGELGSVTKAQVEDRLLEGTRQHHHQFWQCRTCGKVCWRGAHHTGLASLIQAARRT